MYFFFVTEILNGMRKKKLTFQINFDIFYVTILMKFVISTQFYVIFFHCHYLLNEQLLSSFSEGAHPKKHDYEKERKFGSIEKIYFFNSLSFDTY